MNRVCLVGRLVRDPELRYSQSGVGVCNFVIAVDRPFKKDGQPDADFPNVICFNKTAENLAQYTEKGSLVSVEGRLQTRNYENKEGQKVYVTEVVADNIRFLSWKKDGQQGQGQGQSFGTDVTNQVSYDDLPF